MNFCYSGMLFIFVDKRDSNVKSWHADFLLTGLILSSLQNIQYAFFQRHDVFISVLCKRRNLVADTIAYSHTMYCIRTVGFISFFLSANVTGSHEVCPESPPALFVVIR